MGWSGAKPPCGVGWGEVGWDGEGGGGVTLLQKLWRCVGRGSTLLPKFFLGGGGSPCYKNCGGGGGHVVTKPVGGLGDK